MLSKEELAQVGILIDKVVVRICVECHVFIEGMRGWACGHPAQARFHAFREELQKIDAYMKEVLLGPKN